MRVLLIGGGGREHALGWRLKREEPSLELIAAPGNPGLAELGECVPIAATDLGGLERLARARDVDFTLVGPEGPLALGIVDHFRRAGLPIFGPTRAAAEIETSKAFAKQLMRDAGVPTARAEIHTQAASAKSAARQFGAPVVIKASGLAAGKGVIICQTLAEADDAVDDMLEGNLFGDAGHEVLVEEFMEGEELSLFAITDGVSCAMLPGLQDHKRLLDGDRGPNTGGMGAYLPVTIGGRYDGSVDPYSTESLNASALRLVFEPTLRALAAQGRAFTGLLYAGLMLTPDGPKVVEFNCRFGDPETQALMPALGNRTRLLDLFHTVATGRPLAAAEISADSACVATVLAAANYPATPRTGDPITLPKPEDGVHVFHAGTARDAQGQLVTAGGRVLAVTAVASTVEAAQLRSQAFASAVQFAGKQFRSDIGWREIARHRPSHARASGD